jgi:hypothetical protein
MVIATPSGAQIPVEQVAKVSFSRGPALIRDEDGQLTGYVYIDLNTRDYGLFCEPSLRPPDCSILHELVGFRMAFRFAKLAIIS